MGWKKKEKVSYLKQMWVHRYNVNSGLGAVAASLALTIPFGGLGFLPLLAYGTGAAIASLVVPDSRKFRESVDQRLEREAREAARAHLMEKITEKVGPAHPYWATYQRMLERRDSLAALADDSATALQMNDIGGLDDATVDYLGLWLARIAIHERSEAVDERTLVQRIKAVDNQIENASGSADKRRLKKAKSELEHLVRRRQEMRTREASMEASMLSMADAFDEVYQRVISNPSAREQVAAELKVAVERMNAEEELECELEEEFDALLSNESLEMEG